MRNSVFPSFSSHVYSLGNHEVQMPISNASTIELEQLNSYSSRFFLDSQVSNELQLGSFTPLSTVEVSQALDYLPGAEALMTNSMYENISHPKVLGRVSPFEECIENARKRASTSEIISNQTAIKASKKRKSVYTTEENRHQHSEESSTAQQLKAPLRRSNKIGDRVTALQQLVSPFGKTDTASVLQEATVHIKLLQEQIQVLSNPYFRIRPSFQSQGGEEKKADLRSRGLCLVPVSSTVNLTKENGGNGIHRYSTGRSVISRF